MNESLKATINIISIVFLFPALCFSYIGVTKVLFITVQPILLVNQFQLEKLQLHKFISTSSRGSTSSYALGHIKEKEYKLQLNQNFDKDVELKGAKIGDTINVFFYPKLKRVYFQHNANQLKIKMYPLVLEFIFFNTFFTFLGPIFFLLFWLTKE